MFNFNSQGLTLAGQDILSPIELSFHPGETHCLLGPSGCGKSSLLNQVSGLIGCDDSARWESGKPQIGYLFQQPRLLPWRTVRQNLLLVEPDQASIISMLEQVKLPTIADHYPNELSLGMARRVALARCLLLKPDIILMDEPLTSLDLPTAKEMRGLIKRLVCDHPQRSMLYVTHDLDEALELGDVVSVLGGTPSNIIYSAPTDEVSRIELEALLRY